jgi:hypothetical protein
MVASTLWQLIAGVFLGLPILMFVLYVIGIQYERITLPMPVRLFCLVFALPALILDFILEWTVISVYLWQWPQDADDGTGNTEWTISDRLNRLCLQTDWRGSVTLAISKVLNTFAYRNNHIPNAVGR